MRQTAAVLVMMFCLIFCSCSNQADVDKAMSEVANARAEADAARSDAAKARAEADAARGHAAKSRAEGDAAKAELARLKAEGQAARTTPEMQIKRIKGRIAKLDGDIKRNYSNVAKWEVELDAFAAEAKKSRAILEQMLSELKVLDKDPETADSLFAKKWKTYQVAEATVASKEKLLKQKQEVDRTAKAKVDAMIAARQELRTRVTVLETQLEEVRLAQTKSPVQVNDSRLDEVKSALEEIDKRLGVMNKEVAFESRPNSDEPTKVEVKVKGGAQARKDFRKRFGDKHLGEK